jgi:hypothetical protein
VPEVDHFKMSDFGGDLGSDEVAAGGFSECGQAFTAAKA